ncbi:MAG: hypothetical protein PHC88_09925 [Terrimicrobiaceae bacterium]|nr:hypothetical protein [Terrimicrobiaceae bacterium]
MPVRIVIQPVPSAASSATSAASDRGVYILGNDVVLEYAICLFRSLRDHSPQIPVRLIPYDDRLSRLRPWMDRYHIELHEHPDYPSFDRLGDELMDERNPGHRMYRKFAAFTGPFANFLYLDIDIAVLAPVENLFDEFERSQAEFMTFDNDLDNVYTRSAWRDEMERTGRTKGFNAGAFLSRKGLFTRTELLRFLGEAREMRDKLIFQYDQPYFNFVVDMKGVRHERIAELNSAYPDKQWGDQVPIERQNGAWKLLTPNHADYGKAQPFIHWAGHNGGDPFPNRHIFYHYRLLGESALRQIAYRLGDHWRWRVGQPVEKLATWLMHRLRRAPANARKLSGLFASKTRVGLHS